MIKDNTDDITYLDKLKNTTYNFILKNNFKMLMFIFTFTILGNLFTNIRLDFKILFIVIFIGLEFLNRFAPVENHTDERQFNVSKINLSMIIILLNLSLIYSDNYYFYFTPVLVFIILLIFKFLLLTKKMYNINKFLYKNSLSLSISFTIIILTVCIFYINYALPLLILHILFYQYISKYRMLLNSDINVVMNIIDEEDCEGDCDCDIIDEEECEGYCDMEPTNDWKMMSKEITYTFYLLFLLLVILL